MAIAYENSKARTLARFLKRINAGDDPEMLRKEANQLLTSVGPRDIATAEQNLIDDGYSIQLVQLLSATFMLMGMPQEQSSSLRTWLPDDHILRITMVEHDLIRYFLADLNNVVKEIEHLDSLSDVSAEFRKLSHLIEHLNAAKEHLERENGVIFPYMNTYGRISLCRAMQNDHNNIATEISKLVALTVSFGRISLEQFKAALIVGARKLQEMMLEHFSQEDTILFPIALVIIHDAEVWEKMKTVCEQIGYCGVHT